MTVILGELFKGYHFQLWTTNGLVRDLGEVSQNWFQEAAFSRNRRLFFTSGNETTASVRDSATGEAIMVIPTRVDNGTFSPDGQRLATWGGTSVIQIWDLTSSRELLKLKGSPRSCA
ncbi:MAG: hypothetical protein V9H26_06785 [Verrucomicrobiota bacterium]